MIKEKLLVTGGAGFIGSEFIRQAAQLGYTITVLDSITYAGDKKRLKGTESKVTFYKANITDVKAVSKIISKEKPDNIVHFAAETHVDRSILDGQVFLKTNILGTQVLLEIARTLGVGRFIHISTDEVYGDVAKGSSNESSPFRPNSPYSVSKAGADMLVSAYARTYKMPINIVRASNNYGPWQYPEKLIPVVIYKALNRDKIPVFAKGLNVREWLYVADCASGILAVLQKGKIGEVYNISSGIHRRNIDVIKAILKTLARPESLIEFVEDRPGHDFRYSISCTKARRELGWKPEYDFDRGLAQTVAWYSANQQWLKSKVKHLEAYWSKVYRFKK